MNYYDNSAAGNTTTVTYNFTFPDEWVIDESVPKPAGWRALVAWIDNAIVHRLIYGRWGVPQPLNYWLYKYCCWAAEYDWPVYKRADSKPAA